MARKRRQAGGYVYFAAQPPTRRQVGALPSVNQQEVDAAYATVASGDPSGLSAVTFDRSDIELIGRYLETRSIGGQHLVWQTLLHGERWAYGMALHEAAQIAEFIRLGVDFTNPTARQPYYREAHVQALLTELDYWLDWAAATGYPTIKRALLLETPWRKPFNPLRDERLIDTFRPNALGTKTPAELDAAREFFQKVVLQQP